MVAASSSEAMSTPFRPPLVAVEGGPEMSELNQYLPVSAVLARVALRLMLDKYAHGYRDDFDQNPNYTVLRMINWTINRGRSHTYEAVQASFWHIPPQILYNKGNTALSQDRLPPGLEEPLPRYVMGGVYAPLGVNPDGGPNVGAWTDMETLREIAMPSSEFDQGVLGLFRHAFLHEIEARKWNFFNNPF